MKKTIALLLGLLTALTLCCCSVKSYDVNSPVYVPPNVNPKITCRIDTAKSEHCINNKMKMINFWNSPTTKSILSGCSKEVFDEKMPFLEVFEVMTATGGSPELDLFRNPMDYSVVDDYDFSSLIDTCHRIVDFGMKPSLKLGNVPLKLTGKPYGQFHFGVTTYPPYDYDLYYNYIKALTEALVKEFGKEAVQTWRFGVLTEFDNAAWFLPDKDGQDDHLTAYCKLYDYTTSALCDVLGKDVYVGAHAEGASEVASNFIKHCAKGVNYKTGKIGAPLKYIDISFYENFPGDFPTALMRKIEPLREVAEANGLTDLEYGVGEGRILFGNDGKPLLSRIVVDKFQAAFDAMMYMRCVKEEVDYVSNWPAYTSNKLQDGFALPHLHLARLFYKTVGSTSVNLLQKGVAGGRAKAESMAAYNEETQKVYVMGCNINPRLQSTTPQADVLYNIKMPVESGTVKVTKYVIDDGCCFYDDYLKDVKEWGLTDSDFAQYVGAYSKESLMPNDLMVTYRAQQLFNSRLPFYAKASVLTPTDATVSYENSTLSLYHNFKPNTVVFYEIEYVK